MREYMFRGKRVDNGAWETGSLVVIRGGLSDERVYIADKMTGYHTPVIPDTIGQSTGLTDKNGKWIFEGDIVDYETIGRFAATWQPTAASYFAVDAAGKECFTLGTILSDKKRSCVVIGNIYDNGIWT